LIEQINQNFKLIKKCKEQKIAISQEVFKYCESQLHDFSKRISATNGSGPSLIENVLGDQIEQIESKTHKASKRSKRICKNNYLNV